ncbi:hypothetical protein GFS60_08072 (plasmid) [Rhodococcus sp. WAY2]|nr:hypothetical protein GFS60_08072 [Rhodococcus sp. WAY2]
MTFRIIARVPGAGRVLYFSPAAGASLAATVAVARADGRVKDA